MSFTTSKEKVHFRKHRPKRRRLQPNGTRKSDVIVQVFALCGAWVPKRRAVRIDRLGHLNSGSIVCVNCNTAAISAAH